MRLDQGVAARRIFQFFKKRRWQNIKDIGIKVLQNGVNGAADLARAESADGFVDGDDATGVEGGFGVVFVAGEKFRFRMHHLQLTAVAVEFDFAEERDAGTGGEAVGEVGSVEPFGEEDGAGGVGELSFEKAEAFAAETGDFGGADFGYDRGEFAGAS